MYIWLIIFIVLLLIEILTTGLVTIWFAIGALAAFASTYFTSDLDIQVIVFLLVSVVSLIITKPLVKKFKTKNVSTNYDMVIGKEGVVTSKITKNKFGEVKVNGSLWTAKSDQTIDLSEEVIVTAIDGVKLVVKRKEEK